MYLDIDPNRCTGCRICEVFCSFKHEAAIYPFKSRIKVVQGDETALFIPTTCRQCEDPKCVAACPTGALSRDPDTGAILVDEDACTGCEACIEACPFGAMALDTERGVAYTCDLCAGDPECARLCPTGAIQVVSERDPIRSTGGE